jgi:isopenicillin N synthase-like dioxygenase
MDVPVVDLSVYFRYKESQSDSSVLKSVELQQEYDAECKKVACALHQFGLVVLNDPRVSEANNNEFLDMMEGYFEGSDVVTDSRPENAYQVGVTPAHIEKARDHCTKMGAYGPGDKPLSPCPPEFDAKWRFFWRTGPVPELTEFPSQNMQPVLPANIPQWESVMNSWGGKMTDALFTIAEMAAVGFNMPADSFTSRMMYGPHLLAPTGSDLKVFGEVGHVLAGFHYDLNFLTIHGKSRFPGLNVWTRDGKKTGVAIPDGCLLLQAGKQIEYLTGGHVIAGFHEVIVTEATRKVVDAKIANNESVWRVSSTCFGHIQSDQVLQPLAPFDTNEIH